MPWTQAFKVQHEQRVVSVLPGFHAAEPSAAVSSAFAELINIAIDKNVYKCIGGRHSELFLMPDLPYRVVIERFACSLFGIATRGAHLTAYTRVSSGAIKIWVPRRSQNVGTWKGKLDSTVAGGVAADETPYENIIREAAEEASLPANLVQQHVKQVGALTYIGRSVAGENGWEDGMIIPDIVSVFDIELPDDITPRPCDDEVKEFYLMGIDEIKAAMLRKEFKPNSAVIMIDFFVRHGILTIEQEPDYIEIVQRMHRRLRSTAEVDGQET